MKRGKWVEARGMANDSIPIIIQSWARTHKKASRTAYIHAVLAKEKIEKWLSEQD